MTCSVEDCPAPVVARSLCRRHYSRWWRHGSTDLPTGLSARWHLVDKTGDCWVWTGDTRKGYGIFRENGRSHSAHRASYELHVGPIPKGLIVRHSCDNPPCVNPKHLLLGTKRDNYQDSVQRGRAWWQQRDTCKNGHPRSEENVRVGTDGKRRCRPCEREASMKYKQKTGG